MTVNQTLIFVTLYNNNSYFSSIVRGRFRVGVGVIKHNLIGRKLISLFIYSRSCIPSSHSRKEFGVMSPLEAIKGTPAGVC